MEEGYKMMLNEKDMRFVKAFAQLKKHLNDGLEFKTKNRFMKWWKGEEDGGVQNYIDQMHRLLNNLLSVRFEADFTRVLQGQIPIRIDENELERLIIELLRRKQ